MLGLWKGGDGWRRYEIHRAYKKYSWGILLSLRACFKIMYINTVGMYAHTHANVCGSLQNYICLIIFFIRDHYCIDLCFECL